MKKLLALVCILTLVLGVFASCDKKNDAANTSWEYLQNKEEIVMGLDSTFAPMGYTETNGEIVGYDIDVAKAVFAKLDIKVTFKSIDWDAKDLELSSAKIDCIWNGMSITPERQESMSMTPAYLNNKMVIMGKDVAGIKTIADLKGKKIGVQAKSYALDCLKADAVYNDVKANVIEQSDYDKVIMDLDNGRVDVMIIDQVVGEYKNSKRDSDKKLNVAEANFGDDLYGIGFRKGADVVTNKVVNAYNELKASGEIKTISEKWFGKDLSLDMK